MRLRSIRLNKISQMLDYYSNFNPSPLSIKQFLDFGKNFSTSRYDDVDEIIVFYQTQLKQFHNQTWRIEFAHTRLTRNST